MNWAVCSHCLSNSSCRLRGGAPSAVLGGEGERWRGGGEEGEEGEEGEGGRKEEEKGEDVEKGRVNLD